MTQDDKCSLESVMIWKIDYSQSCISQNICSNWNCFWYLSWQFTWYAVSCKSNKNQRWRNRFSEFCFYSGSLFWKKFFETEELALNIFFCSKTAEYFRLKKAPILCFPSVQINATVRHLNLVYRNRDQNYLARWFRVLVILTTFRPSCAGSVIRYERLFESNMFQMWSI